MQSPVAIAPKSQNHAKPGVGQGRTGIKRKILQRFPLPQTHEKPKQPKILPDRKPIIQIAEIPIFNNLKSEH